MAPARLPFRAGVVCLGRTAWDGAKRERNAMRVLEIKCVVEGSELTLSAEPRGRGGTLDTLSVVVRKEGVATVYLGKNYDWVEELARGVIGEVLGSVGLNPATPQGASGVVPYPLVVFGRLVDLLGYLQDGDERGVVEHSESD